MVLSGCAPTFTCDSPYERIVDGRCVVVIDGGGMDAGAEVDADAGADAEADAGADAGPCGMPCTGDTLYCDEASGECVECLERSQCTSAAMPACVDGTCEECGVNTDCPTVAASRCEENSCTGCADDDDCSHVTGLNVCIDGTCVECRSNADCAVNEGCELATNTCRPFTAGTGARCSECVRDAECQAGMLCVQMRFGGQPVGQHCLWRQDAEGTGTPNGDCVTGDRPFVRAESITSIDGTMATVCGLRNSTCEAQDDYSRENCDHLGTPDDALCGREGVADGVCRPFGGARRCTVFCASDDDCRAGITCNIGAATPVCNF